MKTVKTVFITLIVVAIVVPMAGAAFIYAGVYNVGATAKDSFITRLIAHNTREHSVQAHAQGIEAPRLNSEQMIRTGFTHYRENCAACHAGPGIKAFEGAEDMNPDPPDLADSAKEMSAPQLFWIIKHGIKMSGMPAWGPTHTDHQIWAMVAFVKQLPGMTAVQYQKFDAEVKSEEHDHEHDADTAAHADD